MPRREFSDAEIDAAVQVISDPARLEDAQRVVATGQEDPMERLDAVQRLIVEETRVSMLIGVAVGYELAHVLNENRGDD